MPGFKLNHVSKKGPQESHKKSYHTWWHLYDWVSRKSAGMILVQDMDYVQ